MVFIVAVALVTAAVFMKMLLLGKVMVELVSLVAVAIVVAEVMVILTWTVLCTGTCCNQDENGKSVKSR